MCLSPSSSNKIKATLHLDSTDAVRTTKLFYVWRLLSSKSSSCGSLVLFCLLFLAACCADVVDDKLADIMSETNTLLVESTDSSLSETEQINASHKHFLDVLHQCSFSAVACNLP